MGRRGAYDEKDLWKRELWAIRAEKLQMKNTECKESEVERLQLAMGHVTTFNCITVYL